MEKLSTGNEIFDHIASINYGHSVVVLDITRFESMLFLNSLLRNPEHKESTMVISCELVDTPFKTKKIDLGSFHDPTELSIEIERCRRAVGKRGVLIHHYLPHILVKEGEELVLRMIEYWLTKQTAEETVHIFTLPQATFPFFEKKLQALVSGVISIFVSGTGKDRSLSFQILRVCRPEYHMEEFPFSAQDGRLLIKWGDTFTDNLPREEEDEIRDKIEYLKANLPSLRISRISTSQTVEGVNTYDRWLLSQLIGWRLDDVEHYFPERLDEVFRKLAQWNLKGLVTFEVVTPGTSQILSKHLRLSSRFALSLPTNISLFFLRRRHNTIPMKVYHALRRSVQAFVTDRFGDESLSKELLELERYFQDMTARSAAIETYYELGQDPTFKFDLKYLPKLVSLALLYGYGLRPRISNITKDLYKIEVRDCFVCSGVKSEEPACDLLIGTVVGCCSICFKGRFSCNEFECKASGDRSCVFHLRRLS